MATKRRILSDETFAEKMDAQNALLAAIASGKGEGIKVTSWADVQAIVRMGLASKAFSVGDQFECEREKTITVNKGDSTGITAVNVDELAFVAKMGEAHSGTYEFTYDGSAWLFNGEPVTLSEYGLTITGTAAANDHIIVVETTTKIVWDVIGIDHDTPSDKKFTHSLTLQMHDCITALQFDAPEALFYAEEELPAGTYNFTLLAGYDPTYGGGKTYQFTLTKAVPAGGQITFVWGYQVQASTVKIRTYENKTTTTALEEVAVSEGAGGTALESIRACNHTHRIRYGSNNWAESAIRQWLNSSAEKGAVWTPKTDYDRPPSWAASEIGFLRGLDPALLAVLGNVKKQTALNTLTDGGGYVESDERVFLLSNYEMYSGKRAEEPPYPFWEVNNKTNGADYTDDASRTKYRNGAATYWWLRSPYPSYACSVRGVRPSGYVCDYGASSTHGVAPACVIV